MTASDEQVRLRRIQAWFARQNYAETRNHAAITMQQQIYRRLIGPDAETMSPTALQDRVAAIWTRGCQPVRIDLSSLPAPPEPTLVASRQRRAVRHALKQRMQARRT